MAARKIVVSIEIEDDGLDTDAANDLAHALRDALASTAELIEWGARRVIVSSTVEAI